MVRTPSVDKTGLKRGAWSQEEDNRLRAYILKYGHWNWRHLPKFAGLARCGKSCRLRWKNYLRPGLKKGSFSKEEEETIIKLREELGNKWSLIAAKVPGRTDNEIKNYWNSRLKKCMKKEAKANEITIGRSQDLHVMVQKEQDSLISLVESTDQQMDKDPSVAAANVSAKEISFSSYNYSNVAGEAENGFSSEKSFPEFLGSLGTEPVCSRTLHNQSSSSSALGPEDLASEKGSTLEELFVESFSIKPFSSDASNDLFSPSKDFEPVFSNPSSGQISPSTSCNAAVTNGISLEESFVKSFESFLIEPLSSDSSSSLFSPSKDFEPLFSNASSGLISPSISSNSAVANGNRLVELFVKSFESVSTEPFSSDSSNSLFSPSEDFAPVFSNVSSGLIGSNSTVTNGISLEELFVKSFESYSIEPFSADASNNLFLPSKDFEPVSSNASNSLISPPTSCNSTVTNPEESSADAFCWFRTEPIFSNASDGMISSSTSCNPTVTNSADASSDVFGGFWTETLSLDESIHHLQPPEDGASFSSFLDYDVDLLHQV